MKNKKLIITIAGVLVALLAGHSAFARNSKQYNLIHSITEIENGKQMDSLIMAT